MIKSDQPTCFPESIVARVSSRTDGSLRGHNGSSADSLNTPSAQFCAQQGIDYGDVVFQYITYGPDRDYDVIRRVSESDTLKHDDVVSADAVVTTNPKVGLFLPLGDCVGTILYDPKTNQLAVAHLGRHSTIANLIAKTIDYLVEHGARAEDIVIWMAPSVKASHYRMEYFDHADEKIWQPFVEQRDGGYYLNLQGYNRARAIERGIRTENISISPINTAEHAEYFSHSQGDSESRFAILAYRNN